MLLAVVPTRIAAAPAALPAGASAPEAGAATPQRWIVGSKRFTESYLLGELVRQTLVGQGIEAEHRAGLGNTGVLEQALAAGAVDVVPEYTGTIAREWLHLRGEPSLAELNERLAPRGLVAAVPLGFNDSYALAMREPVAEALGVRTISDLARVAPGRLRLGFSHEFLARADGWPALRAAYSMPDAAVAGLDHGLAYDALAAGRVDVIDVYTTDAQLGRAGWRLLVDDRGVFPRYDAVLLLRAGLDAAPLATLAGRIDEATMRSLNAAVELHGLSFAEAARRFLAGEPLPPAGPGGAAAAPADASARARVAAAGLWRRLVAPDLARLVGQHLALVAASLGIAVAVGVPFGILAWRHRRLGAVMLGTVGVLQTVPSLALLAFLVALVGAIGFVPALVALVVYALLPIVRNTHAGLAGVPAGLRLAARALGLGDAAILRHVELPLALPTILAGVQTAAVIGVGTATVAAFVGAGGLGERIVAGLAVNDPQAMLAGALPAALLALAVQAAFGLVEHLLVRSRGG